MSAFFEALEGLPEADVERALCELDAGARLRMDDERLATELRARGWTVTPPAEKAATL